MNDIIKNFGNDMKNVILKKENVIINFFKNLMNFKF